ncbi:MAG: hypothetical protein U0Q07_04185 [Acidimicrobiales bacterium]
MATTATSPSRTSVPVLDQPIAPTGDAAADAELLAIARFVEEVRGHPFRQPVRVERLDDGAFETRMEADVAAEAGRFTADAARLRALGLLLPGIDYGAIVRATTREGVLGVYDPESGELLVRGQQLTPFTRVTIAHELAHALDDQWFDLADRERDVVDDDAAFGLTALVEGSAERVRTAYVEHLSAAERAELAQEEVAFGRAMDLSAVPPSLVEIVQSPYDKGADLVDRLVEQGGNDALDAAFADPPRSSSAVLHPAERLADVPVEVAGPPADRAAAGDGVLGELTLFEVLQTHVSAAEARAAAAGWAGDRFVEWSQPDGTSCLRDDLKARTPEDLARLERALRSWANHRSGATVESVGDDVVRFTACG